MRKVLLVFLLLINSGFAQLAIQENQARTLEIFFRSTSTGNGATGLAATNITCDLTKTSLISSTTKTTFTGTASGGTHDILEVGHGKYNIEIPAADLDTRGLIFLNCQCPGAFDTKQYAFWVVAAADIAANQDGDISDAPTVAAAVMTLMASTYGTNFTNMDSPVSGVQNDTDDLQTRIPAALSGGKMDSHINDIAANAITATSINSDAFTAAKFAADTGVEFAGVHGVITGTATAGGNSTITLAVGSSASDNKYQWSLITLTGGTGAPATAIIQSYVGSTRVATVLCQNTTTGNWITNPDATTTYSIIPFKR